MRSDPAGSHVWFDPVGILIAPGRTVRWTVAGAGNPHTTSAYHPANANHALRIPEGATPWDSGFLLNTGDHFDVTFTAEGVYDYYCTPHEEAGMVGRLVVGRPGGPGTLPFDLASRHRWRPVPLAAQRVLPPIERILNQRVVRRPAAGP